MRQIDVGKIIIKVTFKKEAGKTSDYFTRWRTGAVYTKPLGPPNIVRVITKEDEKEALKDLVQEGAVQFKDGSVTHMGEWGEIEVFRHPYYVEMA